MPCFFKMNLNIHILDLGGKFLKFSGIIVRIPRRLPIFHQDRGGAIETKYCPNGSLDVFSQQQWPPTFGGKYQNIY